MATIEHNIFEDIPGQINSPKYHSAILMSFSIELISFERQIVSQLHKHGISSINLLVDEKQFDEEIAFTDSSTLKELGREYYVTTIPSIGAFHPKINLFIGDKEILVVFGSGNLTTLGQGKNHEAFSCLMASGSELKQMPLIAECWEYLAGFVIKYGNNAVKKRIMTEIPSCCIMLKNAILQHNAKHQQIRLRNNLEGMLCYNDDESNILDQISTIIPDKVVSEISVISPFYDSDGFLLQCLLQRYPNSRIDVVLQENCTLSPYEMKKSDRLRFFDFDETSRGKELFMTGSFYRHLHAKIFHFKTKKGEYLLLGSANATKAAWGDGTSKKAINDEFAILFSSSSIDFLSTLGLSERKKLSVKFEKTNEDNSLKKDNLVKPNIRLFNVEVSGDTMYIYIDFKNLQPKQKIDLRIEIDEKYLNITDLLFDKKGVCSVKCNLKPQTAFCQLIDDKGETISNKQFINWPLLLERTNPSIENRTINHIISELELKGYNAKEFLSHVSSLLQTTSHDDETKLVRKYAGNKPSIKTANKKLPDFDYSMHTGNQSLSKEDVSDFDSYSSSIVRLFDSVKEAIRRQTFSLEDQLLAEEEEGDVNTGKNKTDDITSALSASDNFIIALNNQAVERILRRKEKKEDDKRIENSTKLPAGKATLPAPTSTEIEKEKEDILLEETESIITKIQNLIDSWHHYIDTRDNLLCNQYGGQITTQDFTLTSMVMLIITQLCALEDHVIFPIKAQKRFASKLTMFSKKILMYFTYLLSGNYLTRNDNSVLDREAKNSLCIALMMGTLGMRALPEESTDIRNNIELSLAALIGLIQLPNVDYVNDQLFSFSKESDYVFKCSEVIGLAERLKAKLKSKEIYQNNKVWYLESNGKKFALKSGYQEDY